MFGDDYGLIWGCFVLWVFSYFYDKFVDWGVAQGYGDKYMGYFVVGGVLAVGLVAGAVEVLTWEQVGQVALLFASAGAQMVWGEARRVIRREQAERKRILEGMEE